MTVQGYAARPFAIEAKVAVDPKYDTKLVVEAVTAALREHFAFARREFGQDVSAAETIATIQAVEGVVYVDLDALKFTATGQLATDGRLEARTARLEAGVMKPADLLTLADADIHLTPKAP